MAIIILSSVQLFNMIEMLAGRRTQDSTGTHEKVHQIKTTQTKTHRKIMGIFFSKICVEKSAFLNSEANNMYVI